MEDSKHKHFEQVRKIVADVFGLPADQVHLDLASANLAAWDSLNHLKLMLALEDRFGVTFDTDQLAAMLSVRRICEVLDDLKPDKL